MSDGKEDIKPLEDEGQEDSEILKREIENLKQQLSIERVLTGKYQQQIQRLKRVTLKPAVFRTLYEMVVLEVAPMIHEIQMKQNLLLAAYANKVDPKRFPLSGEEERWAMEMLQDGFEGFLDSLKEDQAKTKGVVK